ncbi:rai16 protein-related [Anaeramoeba flamelloides]|uniref:Rai16 protein-related n=1 Tax=Anaeramoeba flamelloides TaxID=1746091 RepID=A0ABQ8XF88_9EUKA|nr:rai16 protein-related [Anaeramoeba flamelloides]
MFKNIFQSFGEIISPIIKTPFEEFTETWGKIKEFYSNSNKSNINKEKNISQLFSDINNLFRLVVLEDETQEEEKPIIEFFLDQRILETLALLSIKNIPHNLNKIVLKNVTQFVRTLPELIHHLAIRNPILSILTNELTQESFNSEYLMVLLTSLVELFEKSPSTIPLFLEFEDDPNQTIKENSKKKTISNFIVFQGLLKGFEHTGEIGERVKLSIIKCLCLPNQEISRYILEKTTFLQLVTDLLISIYDSISFEKPKKKNVSRKQDFSKLNKSLLYNHLEFINFLRKVTPKAISDAMLEMIKEQFLSKKIIDGLHETDEDLVCQQIYKFSSLFEHIIDPFFVEFFFYPLLKKNSNLKEKQKSIISLLINRLPNCSESYCYHFLYLLTAIFKYYDEKIIKVLFLKHIKNPKHYNFFNQFIQQDSTVKPTKKFLGLSVTKYKGFETTSFHSYIIDAQKTLIHTFGSCEGWECEWDIGESLKEKNEQDTKIENKNGEKEIEKEKENEKEKEKENENEKEKENENGEKKKEREKEKQKGKETEKETEKEIEKEIEKEKENKEKVVEEIFDHSIENFIQILFGKLELFFQNSNRTNILLTGLITRLTRFPSRLSSSLHHYLFGTKIIENEKTLFSILSQLSEKAKENVKTINNFDQEIILYREEVFYNEKNGNLVKNQQRNKKVPNNSENVNQSFYHSLLIFDEWVKELSSILHVKGIFEGIIQSYK